MANLTVFYHPTQKNYDCLNRPQQDIISMINKYIILTIIKF